ncbi:SH3 domain-containing protein [Halovulum dunhuangense]|uniref:SH3 domain-containing protein n=1 Tax=Halovulum dunhuangense TaxID=1505036 RepID=A0A849KX15_9RHOB|nr:SH3 domain-containing protein [Halovulum dunhuangense]NNU78937.1 SH3 domain-containing protein [Halovulum dunhuangense]
MSQFYSDLLSWATVGLAAGAISLDGLSLSPAGRGDAPILVAAAGDTTTRAILREAAARAAAPTAPAPIPRARLERVTFTVLDGPDLGSLTSGLDRPRPAEGRVTGASVNLRSGPGTGFPVIGRAAGGDTLRMRGARDGDWIGVLLPETGEDAWIHAGLFQPQAE